MITGLPKQITLNSNKFSEVLFAFIVAASLLFTLEFIQPFGIRFDFNDLYFQGLIISYALLSFAVVLVNEYVAKRLLKIQSNWFRNSWNTLSICLACLMAYLFSGATIEGVVFIMILKLAVFLVLPAVVISSFLAQSYLSMVWPGKIRIRTLNNKILTVCTEELLFVESADNYLAVYLSTEDGGNRKQLIRSTMKHLEKQLGSGVIARCHRSFMVNPLAIEEFRGNSKSGYLLLKGTSVEIPVSKSYTHQFMHYKG